MVVYHDDFPTGISKVYMKETKKYPWGKNYFYVNTEDLDLVCEEFRQWRFIGNKNHLTYVWRDYPLGIKYHGLHQYIYFAHTGEFPETIDHINGVGIDNTFRNLRNGLESDNMMNRRTRGYSVCVSSKYTWEEEMALAKSKEEECLRKAGYFVYDFFLDRRDELDLLDLEYTGEISHDEAVYRHVLRTAGVNAWYAYRYNLLDYMEEHDIKIPQYTHDGCRMVDINSGALLCPCEPKKGVNG